MFYKIGWKFCKIHRKTPVLESCFNKVAGLNRLHHKRFSMIFAKLLRTLYNETAFTIKIGYSQSKSKEFKSVQRRSKAFKSSRWQMFYKIGWKFCKIHRKTPVLESCFNKVAGLNRLHHKRFSMIFAKLLRTLYNETAFTIKIGYSQSKSTILHQIR